LNKIDLVSESTIKEAIDFFAAKPYCKKVITISALSGINKKKLITGCLNFYPKGTFL
jgi:GTP-binding protein Era